MLSESAGPAGSSNIKGTVMCIHVMCMHACIIPLGSMDTYVIMCCLEQRRESGGWNVDTPSFFSFLF